MRKIVHTSNLGFLQNGQKRNSDTILKAKPTQCTVTGMLTLTPVTSRNRLAFPGSNVSDQLNKGKKGKFVPVLLTKHHAMKAYWGNGSIAPLIL
jgi:hypothetical protein